MIQKFLDKYIEDKKESPTPRPLPQCISRIIKDTPPKVQKLLENQNLQSQKPRLLIAEDANFYREYYKLALQKYFEILFALDGLEAVQMAYAYNGIYQRTNRQLSAILTDYDMPKLDGNGVIFMVNDMKVDPSIKIQFPTTIMATANKKDISKHKVFSSGDWVVKGKNMDTYAHDLLIALFKSNWKNSYTFRKLEKDLNEGTISETNFARSLATEVNSYYFGIDKTHKPLTTREVYNSYKRYLEGKKDIFGKRVFT